MSFQPASLAQLFEPPEHYRGVFGWLCGYSAEAVFLEDALERFSGLTQAQRAHQGRIQLTVMLDPGNRQIMPAEVPGALHVPTKVAKLPFALLHAKVAILGFQRTDGFILRVIVSTGNWTRQTLEASLDLAWHIDVSSEGGDAGIEGVRQDRTDLAAAWDFLSWLCQHFDLRLLDLATRNGSESADARAKFTQWVDKIGVFHRGYRPHFFDSRESSLLSQLPALVRYHATDVRRNYLAVGSGFYESRWMGDAFVPERILGALRKAKLLTEFGSTNLFVNPEACQVVASYQQEIEKMGWKVRVAHTPGYFRAASRELHGKFIFSANDRKDSNKCGSPWVYLGSGNLTNPGFTHKAGREGNLEAGVVVGGTLRWEADGKKDDGADVVTNLLPIHWDGDRESLLPKLQAGQDMPERDAAFVAAPVAAFLWEEHPDGARLSPQGEVREAFALLDVGGGKCERWPNGSFKWPGDRPRQVTVTWLMEGHELQAVVPVIDDYGRICATELPCLDLEGAWIQLDNFPMPPDDEELNAVDSVDSVDGVLVDSDARVMPASAYPIRRMMILVEEIAAKQIAIGELDWTTWCNRLRQALTQAKDSAAVRAFQSMKLNPLHPLLHPEFRPAFAKGANTKQGQLYEGVLASVVAAWVRTPGNRDH